jgi:hypothetical protein
MNSEEQKRREALLSFWEYADLKFLFWYISLRFG